MTDEERQGEIDGLNALIADECPEEVARVLRLVVGHLEKRTAEGDEQAGLLMALAVQVAG